jgi:hypothetical protein
MPSRRSRIQLSVCPEKFLNHMSRRESGARSARRPASGSQSPFTLRHTRLTVSLPTSPPITLRSARCALRALVPARYAPAIGASAARVRLRQRPALPLRRLSVRSVQPGAWHRDLGVPERAGQRAYPAPMPMVGNNQGPSLSSAGPARRPTERLQARCGSFPRSVRERGDLRRRDAKRGGQDRRVGLQATLPTQRRTSRRPRSHDQGGPDAGDPWRRAMADRRSLPVGVRGISDRHRRADHEPRGPIWDIASFRSVRAITRRPRV